MNNNEWIRLEGLAKHYSDEKKITDISLTIEKPEIFALCGGNGAGKSTLIKMLTGITKPTSGRIFLDGKEVDPQSFDYKKLFSYMPDEMLLPRQLTGLEVLAFFARLRGISDGKVSEVLQQVGLYDVRKMPIKQYSKGMQQRLSLAQALMPDVPLRILDEPTNGLDPFWVFRFKEIIQEEKRQGRTIFFTTHILSLVEELADRAAFMQEGKMHYCDSVDTLVQKNGVYTPLEKVFFK
ncbi:ABC transporter ATP-binding protein [Mesobacillus subterraneus]|uniref:ABC transporter ATP-binding protein n=1 Tax=Mesobacillus subterraneus TaxID=285983 RepID=UPI00203FD948|nr:ABC transporter ATP-binding protein [Mesobacillus subterraneus]MCM3667177.1 ABC transporter ATP-binding protein [Mesobacillus subterraneus]MCM3686006.1 ABC transporter ATP-binding protein [Mesobacillus subterraneus]